MGINLTLALPGATAAFLGAVLGPNLSRRVDTTSLQRHFIVVLLIAAIWLLYRAHV